MVWPVPHGRPVLEEIATEYADKISVVKLSIDENPAVSQRYSIMAIPTMTVFSGGQVVKQIVGPSRSPLCSASSPNI
jgi:thioredoxin 1